jgi:ATP-dependent DNA helicase DinG
LHLLVTDLPAGQLRLTEEFAAHEVWAAGLERELDALLTAFNVLRETVEVIVGRLEGGELNERRQRLLQELRAVNVRLADAATTIVATLRPAVGGEPVVRWIERSGRKGTEVMLSTVPLDLAPVLRDLLFSKVKTIVLTSATLAAGGDFEFIESRLGLAGEQSSVTVSESFASPFDYLNQCLFGIPTDLPDPRDDEAGHSAAVAGVILDLAWAADGGMFALFTSHAALQRAAVAVRSAIGSRWPLLVQGEMPRDALLRRFREAGNGILLGTDSFWEGVDVPGRALRALILTKLPFKVPSEPVTAARLERLTEQGEDGFFRYLLPHAALKLKQGFGRLIRSRRDVGAVVLLDSRVVVRRYGPMVLNGLPRAEQVIGPWSEVRTHCEDFFARHGIGAQV